MAVIRGESCFEKNAFEDTENLHPPTKTRLLVKEYLGEIFEISKKNCFILKLFIRPILFHGKLSFDNLTYFKLYGNLIHLDCRVGSIWRFVPASWSSCVFVARICARRALVFVNRLILCVLQSCFTDVHRTKILFKRDRI